MHSVVAPDIILAGGGEGQDDKLDALTASQEVKA